MYLSGKGVSQNDSEAVKWFRKAEKQGNTKLFGELGWRLITQGKFDEAQTIIEKAHKLAPDISAWTLNMGHTYLLKGDHQTARRYYQKALLSILEDANPYAQFETAIAAFEFFIKKGWQVKACRSELDRIRPTFKQLKLAKTYYSQFFQYYQRGLFQKAMPLVENAYRLRKEILGEKHPSTLASLNNLALIYQKLGRLSEALPLYEKAYRLFSEVLGEKHPNTLTSLNHLAVIYQDLGRLSEALPLFEKAYRLRSEVLGEKWGGENDE
jgi:tetratricopeptide (TPR) repeat protein